MQYECLEKNELVSTIELRNEAFEIWFDMCRHPDYKLVYPNDAVVLFRERKGKIPPNTSYINYLFVDTETGEQMELNCSMQMDKLNKRNDIYPPVIKIPIMDYEIRTFQPSQLNKRL